MTKDFVQLSALDLEGLERSVESNYPGMKHEYRREQYHRILDRHAQPLATIAEKIAELDMFQDRENGDQAYRGALLALMAIVEVLNDETTDTDMTGRAAAVHLSQLASNDVVESYDMATKLERSPESGAVEANEAIYRRLQSQYPALSGLVDTIVGAEGEYPSAFQKGIRYGAMQMLLAVDSVVQPSLVSSDEKSAGGTEQQ